MAPVVHGLEAEYSSRMDFVYLDIDNSDNNLFKQTLGFRYQPHFFLLDEQGKILQQWLGAVPEGDLRAAFEQYIP
jgi:thioredoxin-like negative regulator of GroEL